MDDGTHRKRVLIVDDDDQFLRAFGRRLSPNFVVCSATTAADAIEAAAEELPDVFLVDVFLGAASGISLIAILRSKYVDTPIAALSGSSRPGVIVEAMKAGANDYIVKSEATANRQELANRLERLCSERSLISEHSRDLHHAKRGHIARVLEECRHNVSEAARRLGLKRSSLQRMLRKLGLSNSSGADRDGR